MPQDVIKARSAPYLRRGRPAKQKALTNGDDYTIVATYGAIYRGTVQYYLLAGDAWRLHRLRWVMETSMLKTLAGKHHSSVSKMAARHKAKIATAQACGPNVGLVRRCRCKALDIQLPWGHRAGDTMWLDWGLMKRLVEFPLDQGGSVLVEVDEQPAGPPIRGFGKDHPTLTERTDKTFEEATANVIPAARSLVARLRSIGDPPDEIGIEFGVRLSAQAGAFIASAAAEANFTVSMTWRRTEPHH